jgi:hypothetical protein
MNVQQRQLMKGGRRAEQLYESRPDPRGKGLGSHGRLPSLCDACPGGVALEY